MPETALVIGAGPAGLMAAEALAGAGVAVTVAEAMPTVGRRLLMAGRSGLNLTKDEPRDRFLAAFGPEPPPALRAALAAFGPAEAMAWARSLGQEVFTGSSSRVFPVAMKASPLLRAWLARLAGAGVRLRTRLRWTGFGAEGLRFAGPDGPEEIAAQAVVLATGGASWPRLGSDGAALPLLAAIGLPVRPFRPANMGFDLDWSPAMAALAGTPVKGVALGFGGRRVRGEFAVTRTGIEGGAVYVLAAALRDALEAARGAPVLLEADLAPDRSAAALADALARARAGDSLASRLRKAARLPPAKIALLREAGMPDSSPAGLAARIKGLPLPLLRPRPLAEAISSAGGLAFAALDADLMAPALPGLFAAGEMLDWEAPTGGYLLTACLATGRHAGQAAAAFLAAGGRLSLRAPGAPR